MSLSVPNTVGEINQIQYQSNTVQNESIKYSTNESLNEDLCFGSYFRVVSYYFLPRIWNSKFFQRKSPAMLRCKTCLLQIVHFPFKRKFEWWPWMSHWSHVPYADESWQSRARRGWVTAGTRQGRVPVSLVPVAGPSKLGPAPLRFAAQPLLVWVMAVTSPTRMSHCWNTPGPGTSEPGTSGWTVQHRTNLKQTWSSPSSFRGPAPPRLRHGSHEPDADESGLEHARTGYQWARYQWLDQANLVQLLQPLLVSRWVSILGPEPDAGSRTHHICAHRNTCLPARQWIINIISQR